MMKKLSKVLPVSDVWDKVQSGKLNFAAMRHSAHNTQQQVSLIDFVAQLQHQPKANAYVDEITEYLKGNYRDVFRRLDRQENLPCSVIALKVICLLQMEIHEEANGIIQPRSYLRDKVLKEIKQAEGASNLKTAIEWLELFCFGHELPADFWNFNTVDESE